MTVNLLEDAIGGLRSGVGGAEASTVRAGNGVGVGLSSTSGRGFVGASAMGSLGSSLTGSGSDSFGSSLKTSLVSAGCEDTESIDIGRDRFPGGKGLSGGVPK